VNSERQPILRLTVFSRMFAEPSSVKTSGENSVELAQSSGGPTLTAR
jgi:hypothetical protein